MAQVPAGRALTLVIDYCSFPFSLPDTKAQT